MLGVAILLCLWCAANATEPEMSKSLAELLRLQHDDDRTVRSNADDEILRRADSDEAVIQDLISLLGSANYTERYYAASYLGRIGPKAKCAILCLAELLEDPKQGEGVKAITANSLGLLGLMQRRCSCTPWSIVRMRLCGLGRAVHYA